LLEGLFIGTEEQLKRHGTERLF